MALSSSVHTSHTADLSPANLDRASLNFQYIETQLGPTFLFIFYDPVNGNYLFVTLNNMIASLFEICDVIILSYLV